MKVLKILRYLIRPCLPVNASMRVYVFHIWSTAAGRYFEKSKCGEAVDLLQINGWIDCTGAFKREKKFLPHDHIANLGLRDYHSPKATLRK